MAFKAKVVDKQVKYDVADKFAVATLTEQYFCNAVVDCVDAGLIKKTDTQRKRYDISSHVVREMKNYQLLTNSKGDIGKMRVFMGCGDHLSPLQEQNDSSRRVREVTIQMEIAQRLFEKQYPGNKMHAFMLTLTVPNARKGNLKEHFENQRKRVSALIKSLKDGSTRKNGLQLVGDGDFVGAFVSHELTINDKALNSESIFNLYNDHSHVIVLTNDDIDVDESAKVLFAKWQKLNAKDFNLARGAFDFERAYSKNSKSSASIEAVKEAVKYAVKPATWNQLKDTKTNKYQREVFSEIYNSLAGVKKKMSHGILRDASMFLRLFSEFENSISYSVSGGFPDLVTQLVSVEREKNRFVSKHLRKLTNSEIIYHNKDIIKNMLVSAELEAELFDYIDTELSLTDSKSQLFVDVFREMTFVNSVDDLISHIGLMAAKADAANQKEKACDLRLFADAIEENVTYIETVHSEKPVLIWKNLFHSEWEYPDNDVAVDVARQRDFLIVDCVSEIKYKNQIADDFAKIYKQKFGSFDSDFSKLKNKLSLDTSFSKSRIDVNLFADVDGSVEEFFARKFENSTGATTSKSDKVA